MASDWCDLEKRSDCRFFLSWDWIECWLSTIEADVFLFEGRAGGQLVALGLLCRNTGQDRRWQANKAVYLHQTGDSDSDRITIEYNGLLLDRTVPQEKALQGLRALVNAEELSWDELFLSGLSEKFADLVAAGGFRARLLSRSPTTRVNLAALRNAGIDYLDQRSANTRSQIRRSIRRYEARGPLELSVARDVHQGLQFLDELAKLHQNYWTGRGQEGAFSSRFFVEFHRRLIETALPKGRVELLHLSAGGSTIGYLYNFVYRKTVYYYTSGFVYEEDNRIKPGFVAHTKCVERYLAEGMDWYDFLAGEARYKASLGEIGPDVVGYVLEKPSAKNYAVGCLRRIRNLAKRLTGVGVAAESGR